jgi:EmrB/QacA subfamily drug resistance transporter
MPLSHRQILTVYLGLALAMLVASLDQTIVGTALPTIVGELGGLAHLGWVGAAYLVASTAAAVIFGKLSDLYDRKRVFQVALLVFLAGSALAGAAHTLGQLIAFRAVQGVGGGGLMALTLAVVADLVPPRQRGRYAGYLGGVFALATVAGPFVGGLIVDHAGWRWIFYLNLPVGVAALAVIGVVLRLPPRPRRAVRLDLPGAALLLAAVGCIVLVASWGGSQYPWRSAPVLALGTAGTLAVALFVLVERRAGSRHAGRRQAEPLLPLGLFANPVLAVTSAVGFLTGLAMFGSIVFMPLFLQVAKGSSATDSGLLLLPLMAGVLAGSVASGQLVTRTGRYKLFPVAGTALMTTGFWLLSRVRADTSQALVTAEMALLGLGIGLTMQVLIVAGQSAVERRHTGLVTSLSQFFRELGGSIGVAVFGAVFASRIGAELGRRLPADVAAGLGGTLRASPAQLKALPPAVHQAVTQAVAASVDTVFLRTVPFAAAAFLLTLLLRELPLRDAREHHAVAEPAAEPELEGSGEPERNDGTVPQNVPSVP